MSSADEMDSTSATDESSSGDASSGHSGLADPAEGMLMQSACTASHLPLQLSLRTIAGLVCLVVDSQYTTLCKQLLIGAACEGSRSGCGRKRLSALVSAVHATSSTVSGFHFCQH